MNATSTRTRKMSCEECGYTVRVARSWMTRGFPTCPCGGEIKPTEPADLAFCGLLTEQDMPGPLWTDICRANGWENAIIRRGNAAKSYNRRIMKTGAIGRAGAAHCVEPSCGLWIRDGADRCSAGHAQHECEALEAMPF